MKINPTAFVFWAFLSIIFHLFGGNWMVGLAIGLGFSFFAEMFFGE